MLLSIPLCSWHHPRHLGCRSKQGRLNPCLHWFIHHTEICVEDSGVDEKMERRLEPIVGSLDATLRDLNSRGGLKAHVAEGGILGTSFVGSVQGSVRKVEGRRRLRVIMKR